MTRPRILVLCPDIPYPIIAGGHMRMASIIPALAAAGTVHVCFIDKGTSLSTATTEWFANLGVTYASRSRNHHGAAAFTNKISMLVHRDNLFWNRDEQRETDKQIAQFKPDCIWLETPYQLRYMLQIKKTIPVIVDYWGLLSEGSYRDFLHAPLQKKGAKLLYWLIAKSAEKRYASMFSWAVSVSTPISTYLQTIAPSSHIYTVPNGIVKVNPATAERYTSAKVLHDLIMTGDFSFTPNIDATLFFVNKILPLIRKHLPGVTIRLSGRDPAAEVQALAQDPHITLSGYVEDLLMEIAQARVYILPLRMGSGIRSKLFDVFPLGKPIVVTPTGAEGLELIDKVNCLVAETPELFAKCCIDLLRDDSLRTTLGGNARKLAAETYAQGSIDHKINEIIGNVMESTSL